MESKDNRAEVLTAMGTIGIGEKKTWKDFSPPTSVRDDSTSQAEIVSTNIKAISIPNTAINSRSFNTSGHSDRCVNDEEDGAGESGPNQGTFQLEHKVQIMEGPVIRMGMGALTSRSRDATQRSHPDSLPVVLGAKVLATWKDVSPPKERRSVSDFSQVEETDLGQKEKDSVLAVQEEKNRNPIRTNPFLEGGIYRGNDSSGHNARRIRCDAITAGSTSNSAAGTEGMSSATVTGSSTAGTASSSSFGAMSLTCSNPVESVAVALTTWKDVSPTKSHDRHRKRPESGYFSNDVQSEGGQESREEIDSSLSDSDSCRRATADNSHLSSTPVGGTEDGCFHSSDYFYEDEFSVQFDTNLREAVTVVPEDLVAAGDSGEALPLEGSYTKFRDSLLQGDGDGDGEDLYQGPYESELSGSHTSMDVSSSERDMMCSSDVLNFSHDPLFTPSPPPVEQQQQQQQQLERQQQQQQQHVSTDSLTHQNGMGNSRSSDPDLGMMDCGIRKDAYFLSFNGSQHKSTSESDISYVSQASSHDDQQEGDSPSESSSHGEDAEDEGSKSNSFQDNDDDNKEEKPPSQHTSLSSSPTNVCRPVRNMLLSRYPGRICLEALQDYLLSRSSSSKSQGSSRHSCSSNCKLSPICGPLISSGDLFLSSGHRRGLRRSSNLTTWKQVKNLKKLGREQNLHERSNSMPNLTEEDVKVVRRETAHHDLDAMADSFHKKRHSASILELYQRLMMSSSPPSPTTLGRIDQFLFQEGFAQEMKAQYEKPACPSCGVARERRPDFHLDLKRETQCGRSVSSALTSVSPQTLTLWCGQKNFSSQFPPKTSDCGVQASLGGEEDKLVSNRSMQTSPASPGTDFIHFLQNLTFGRNESKNSKFEPKSSAQDSRSSIQESKTSDSGQCDHESRNPKREKHPMTRAKSATECRDSHAERLKAQVRRTVSLSPSRIGTNPFYTHNSLPDLSILSSGSTSRRLSKSRDSQGSHSSSGSSPMSLFDPVQIPIILTPVLEEGAGDSGGRSHCRSSSASSGCGCGKDSSGSGSGSRRRKNSGRCGGEGGTNSSGSTFSLSSSSGYMEPRCMAGLAPELEHLLFYPPHLESAFLQLGFASELKHSHASNHGMPPDFCREASCKAECCAHSETSASPPARCAPTLKLERYANEAYPCPVQACGITKAGNQRQGQISSAAAADPNRLDALKEEKTPSPEPSSYCHYPLRDYTDHHCFGGLHDGSEGESSQELDEEKFAMYQRWLQERKPPLKSCLRKRCNRDHKARSLSTLNYQVQVEKAELPPEKPPRRQNRHSIACDGMMPDLVDEDGFDYTPVASPCHICPPPTPPTAMEYAGEKVVLRRKKPSPSTQTISEGSLDGMDEDTLRGKRVSFAQEVSFHSPNYTPQGSPRRQEVVVGAELTAVQMEDDVLTLQVIRRNRSLPHCIDPGKAPGVSASPADTKKPPAPSAEVPNLAPGLSPLDYKVCIIRGVVSAAEALIQHFAQARDPFEKVRLGSSQETAEVGSLVVASLCPAIERVVRDGMKQCATGLHFFGKIQLSPWRVTECSAEVGPYTRAINELVKKLKVRPNLVSHRQKFYAFLAGLLNLRLLDFWMGYLSTKENIMSRFYDDDAIVCLSRSSVQRHYQDMLLALQPLAILPFQIDYELVAGSSLVDSNYMGESDIDPHSLKKQEPLSSSPKIVIARAKSSAGTSPNRASWAGPTDGQLAKTDRMDLSATWDWIKTTTIPRAKSLMSDIALIGSMTCNSSATLGPASASTTPRPASASATPPALPLTPTTQTTMPPAMPAPGSTPPRISRLSQDLASVGIVTSRQSLSITASAAETVVASLQAERAEGGWQEMEDEEGKHVEGKLREEAALVEKRQQITLPAVVMDHGAKTTSVAASGMKSRLEVSPARQKAEDILRRRAELSPQNRVAVVRSSPRNIVAGFSEKKASDENSQKQVNTADCSKDGKENLLPASPCSEGSPLKCSPVASPSKRVDCSSAKSDGSPQRRTESSPIRIQEASPTRRQSGSPQRQSESPQRQSGSPSRGPLINPGSPKSTVSGIKERECPEVIARRSSKVLLDDFSDDDETEDGCRSKEGAGYSAPGKVEERVYREGKTDYAFDSISKPTDAVPAAKGEPVLTSTTVATKEPAVSKEPATAPDVLAESASPSQNANQGRSRLSGLRRLSPRGTFSIISFFDRLLLPAEKSAAATTAATSPAVKAACMAAGAQVPQRESEWDSTVEQGSSVATVSSSTSSLRSVASPTPPGSLHTSSSASNNSSPKAKVPKTQAKTTPNRTPPTRASRIPKRQADSPSSTAAAVNTAVANTAAKNAENNAFTAKVVSNCKTERKTNQGYVRKTGNTTPRQQTPDPIPINAVRRTSRSETPEVDINANSPEYAPSEPDEMFVEHNPMGPWSGSSSDTAQSDGSGQSVSMEEVQTCEATPTRRVGVVAAAAAGGPLKMPAYKFVQTLVACDPDDLDLLTYQQGDQLQVLALVNPDWLFCTNGQRDGLVRTAAVRPLRP